DPCSIPDEVIAAAGLDPVSKSSMAADGYITPGWTICGWNGPAGNPWYSYTVYFSSVYTLQDVRENPRNTGFSEIEVGGRPAESYNSGVTDRSESCDVAFDTAQGLAMFGVQTLEAGGARGDMCGVVTAHTEAISRSFPTK
ncbi:MAG: DUF3558 domain-containing protein, partial [Rhodococcus sp. (in: high G+C Gram-positive bacteria)]